MRMSPVVVWSPASLNTGNRGGSLYPGSPVTLPPPGCPVTLYPVVCIMLMLHRHASRCSHCSINVIFSSCILAYLQLERYCNIKSERKVLSIVYSYFCIGIIMYVAVHVSYSGFDFAFNVRKMTVFNILVFKSIRNLLLLLTQWVPLLKRKS